MTKFSWQSMSVYQFFDKWNMLQVQFQPTQNCLRNNITTRWLFHNIKMWVISLDRLTHSIDNSQIHTMCVERNSDKSEIKKIRMALHISVFLSLNQQYYRMNLGLLGLLGAASPKHTSTYKFDNNFLYIQSQVKLKQDNSRQVICMTHITQGVHSPTSSQ